MRLTDRKSIMGFAKPTDQLISKSQFWRNHTDTYCPKAPCKAPSERFLLLLSLSSSPAQLGLRLRYAGQRLNRLSGSGQWAAVEVRPAMIRRKRGFAATQVMTAVVTYYPFRITINQPALAITKPVYHQNSASWPSQSHIIQQRTDDPILRQLIIDYLTTI